MGHFARVLVNVNLSSNLPNSLMLKRDGACLFISVHYDNLLDFYNLCNSIRHTSTNCHQNIPHPNNSNHKKWEPLRQSRDRSKVRQEYRPNVDETSSLTDLNIFVLDSVVFHYSMDYVSVEGMNSIHRMDSIDHQDLNDQ